MTENSTAVPIDKPISFSDPEVQACPFVAYDKLRDECPVYKDPVTGHYVLTRYSDVRRTLIDHKRFSNNANMLGRRENEATPIIAKMLQDRGWPLRDSIQLLDEPEHRAKRSLIDKAFSHWSIQGLTPYIEQTIHELIDDISARGECEFVSEFAVHLTMRVIANQLGVKHEDDEQFNRDAARLRFWSDCAMEIISPTIPPARELELTEHIIDMQHFSVSNIQRLIAEPNDSLLSNLISVVRDENGEPDIPELIILMRTILVAGNETTRFTLAAGIKTMIDQPELQEQLRADPALIDTFVEEVLRLRTPVQTLFRRAKEDVEIDGVLIPTGARVEVRYGAANRDPAEFADPTEVDFNRTGRQHLAFGVGIHSCVGLQLAKAELRAAFRLILERLANLRMQDVPDAFGYAAIYTSYGLNHLKIAFDRRGPAGA